MTFVVPEDPRQRVERGLALERAELHAHVLERLCWFSMDDSRAVDLGTARVLVDVALEHDGLREVSDSEVFWTLDQARLWTHYYRLEYSSRGPFGIDATSYDHWLNSPGYGSPLTASILLEQLDRARRRALDPDCPFLDLDGFDVRSQCPVPISAPAPKPEDVAGAVQESVWFVDWGGRPVRTPFNTAELVVPQHRHVVRISNVDTDIYGEVAPRPRDEFADCPLSPKAIDQVLVDYARMLGVPASLLPKDGPSAAIEVKQRQRRLDGR